MHSRSLTQVARRRVALVALAVGVVLVGSGSVHQAQAQSTLTCLVAEGATCAAGPAGFLLTPAYLPDGVDQDGDTLVDEDPGIGLDDDGDTLIDEDPANGIDDDGDTLIDEEAIDDDGDTLIDEDGSQFVVEIRVEDFADVDDDGDTLPDGLGAFEIKVGYDPAVVSVWTVSDQAEVQALFLGSSGRSVTCLGPHLGTEFVMLTCTTSGWSPPGPTGSGVLARVTFHPGPQALASTDLTLSTILADMPGNSQPHAPQGATVTVLDPLVDTDGDGCFNGQEIGADPNLGGTRDPQNPWDFYDVPVPTLHAGGSLSNRDGAVSLFNDVLAVMEYSGTSDGGPPNGNGIDYDEDMDGDTVDDGRAYDRSPGAYWPQVSGTARKSDLPDGGIGLLSDVLLVLDQSGHNCGAPP